MAGHLLGPCHEPLWPLEDFCENTDSVSFDSRDPGNRCRYGLLGYRAECAEHTIDVARSTGAATIFVTRYDASAIDAADTKPVEPDAAVADPRHATDAGSDASSEQSHAGVRGAANAIRTTNRIPSTSCEEDGV